MSSRRRRDPVSIPADVLDVAAGVSDGAEAETEAEVAPAPPDVEVASDAAGVDDELPADEPVVEEPPELEVPVVVGAEPAAADDDLPPELHDWIAVRIGGSDEAPEIRRGQVCRVDGGLCVRVDLDGQHDPGLDPQLKRSGHPARSGESLVLVDVTEGSSVGEWRR